MNRTLSIFQSFCFEIVLTIGLSATILTGAHSGSSVQGATTEFAQKSTSGSVPVIVELFTSEGCSSCPPADALLARLEAQQPIPETQIIALEEHVDYWDSLGWRDPFSSREWTERQQDYAASLGNGSPYTPQIVVDGRIEFVGSHERQAQQVIARAATGVKAEISLTLEVGAKPSEQFNVTVGKLPPTSSGDASEVWLAITEAGLHSNVTRGENAGKELNHASVVRALRKIGTADQTKDLPFSRNVTLSIDSQWHRENLHAVAFVQDRKSRKILGATLANIGK